MTELLEQLKDSLVREPFNSKLRERYAGLLFKHEDYEGACHQYELLIKQIGGSAKPHQARARCLLHLGRIEEALSSYDDGKSYEDFEPDEQFVSNLESVTSDAKSKLRIIVGGHEAPQELAEVIQLEHPKDLVRFSDIAGMAELKKTLRLKIIEPFLKPAMFARFKKRAGGGVLLYGPPGCGKTMAARAIATECSATFISVGISDVLNMYIGESENNLACLFEKARAERPCVLFFDELDALAYSRSKSNSAHTRTIVNEFLQQLDGIDLDNQQILFLAASNMPWDVDSAMKRPGRFARSIFVPPPDEAAREEMFRKKLNGVPVEEISYWELAKMTPMYSGADIDGLIEEAKEYALADIIETGQERSLRQSDLDLAFQNATPSTVDWLQTARNLVKYAGRDASYREVEKYLRQNKFY